MGKFLSFQSFNHYGDYKPGSDFKNDNESNESERMILETVSGASETDEQE